MLNRVGIYCSSPALLQDGRSSAAGAGVERTVTAPR